MLNKILFKVHEHMLSFIPYLRHPFLTFIFVWSTWLLSRRRFLGFEPRASGGGEPRSKRLLLTELDFGQEKGTPRTGNR